MNLVDSPNCLDCVVQETDTHLFTECILFREACVLDKDEIVELITRTIFQDF